MFFHKKKKVQTASYDRTKKIPVIRSSICTGEKVAGFKEITTGKFEDLMCIRTNKDYQNFLTVYGIQEDEIKKEY
ncbi:MAG: aspartate dehydrogenase [Clostridiales bacterium]|nr:aspartate dehydrogenase [Clostridiales bacterium]